MGPNLAGVASCRTVEGATLPPVVMNPAAQFAQVSGRGAGLASLRNPSALAAAETVPVNIGVIPAGKSVTIRFDVIVADPLADDVNQVSNQAVLSGSNFASVYSDDLSTLELNDPTITRLYHTPAAEEDEYTVDEDMVLSVLTPGVLQNDHASPGFTLSAVGDTLPSVGNLDLKSYGAFTYITAPNANGDETFTYHVNDGVNNSDPALVTVHVTPVNDAPVLDPAGSMQLDPVEAGDLDNPGALVSDLLDSAGDRISDVDADALEGIAITAADTAHGQWQFSTDQGLTWNPLGQPDDTAARLLASNADTRLRFISDAAYSGSIDQAITFRAWDRTSGINGETADVSTSGGESAYSTALETAKISVTPLADLALSLSASEQNPLAGNQVVYSLRVTNHGPGVAQAVKVTGQLPAGTSLISLGKGCTESSGQITCSQAVLNAGSSVRFDLTVKIDLDTTGALTHFASVTSQTQDPEDDNNSASLTLMVEKQAEVVDPDQPPDPKEWNRPIITQPECGDSFMGEYSNETVSLNLSDLPQHSQVIVEFDLVIIRSWDGNQINGLSAPALVAPMGSGGIGPDVWRFSVDNQNLITTTFSNWDAYDFHQAYPGSFPGGDYPARTGATVRNSLCYTFTNQALDSIYHMRYVLPHTAGDLKLDFSASGLQRIQDESWGLDNVSVRISSGAEESTNRYYFPMMMQ